MTFSSIFLCKTKTFLQLRRAFVNGLNSLVNIRSNCALMHPLLTLGENLCAIDGNQHRMLELRVEAAIHRNGGPAVVPHLAPCAPHGQGRLCRNQIAS